MSSTSIASRARSLARLSVRYLMARFPSLSEPKIRLVTAWRRLTRTPFESDFQILAHVAIDPGRVILDIGANRGQSIDAIRLFHKTAQIVSFEANPRLAADLQRRFQGDANLRINAYGLGDQPGRFTLFLPCYNGLYMDGLASIDRSKAEGWLNRDRLPGFDPARLRIEEVSCEVRCLDAEDLDPAFIKIDVQGFEPQVLEGGRRMLAKSQPILLIEHDGEPPALLTDLGYLEYRYEAGAMHPVRQGADRASNSFHLTEGGKQRLMQAGIAFPG